MGRGRNRSVSPERYLLEMFLQQDRAVFVSELAETLDVSDQTVRNNMDDLEGRGLVKIDEVSGRKLLRLTDEGRERISEEIRARFD